MQIHFLTTDPKIADETAGFLKEWGDNKAHIVQQTSGSTGKPKSIEIDKRRMRASAQMTGDFFNLQNKSTALLCISPAYIGGKMMIVRSLEFDLDLYATDISSTPLRNLNHTIDFAAMVPLQVSETLKHHPEKLNLIDHLIIGGAPVSRKLEEALQEVNCSAYSTYGMTETISHVALKKLNNQNSPFQAIGNSTFKVDEGQLIINAPDLEIEDLKTNDIVRLINERSFHWQGRSDFTINSGGVKIHPEIVEQKLSTLFPEERFIIAGIPDEKLGQRVIFIAEDSIEQLVEPSRIEQILDKYEVPKSYFYVPKLARTRSGKRDRLRTLTLIDAH